MEVAVRVHLLGSNIYIFEIICILLEYLLSKILYKQLYIEFEYTRTLYAIP